MAPAWELDERIFVEASRGWGVEGEVGEGGEGEECEEEEHRCACGVGGDYGERFEKMMERTQADIDTEAEEANAIPGYSKRQDAAHCRATASRQYALQDYKDQMLCRGDEGPTRTEWIVQSAHLRLRLEALIAQTRRLSPLQLW